MQTFSSDPLGTKGSSADTDFKPNVLFQALVICKSPPRTISRPKHHHSPGKNSFYLKINIATAVVTKRMFKTDGWSVVSFVANVCSFVFLHRETTDLFRFALDRVTLRRCVTFGRVTKDVSRIVSRRREILLRILFQRSLLTCEKAVIALPCASSRLTPPRWKLRHNRICSFYLSSLRKNATITA